VTVNDAFKASDPVLGSHHPPRTDPPVASPRRGRPAGPRRMWAGVPGARPGRRRPRRSTSRRRSSSRVVHRIRRPGPGSPGGRGGGRWPCVGPPSPAW
jgi:hypothetical protein